MEKYKIHVFENVTRQNKIYFTARVDIQIKIFFKLIPFTINFWVFNYKDDYLLVPKQDARSYQTREQALESANLAIKRRKEHLMPVLPLKGNGIFK